MMPKNRNIERRQRGNNVYLRVQHKYLRDVRGNRVTFKEISRENYRRLGCNFVATHDIVRQHARHLVIYTKPARNYAKSQTTPPSSKKHLSSDQSREEKTNLKPFPKTNEPSCR